MSFCHSLMWPFDLWLDLRVAIDSFAFQLIAVYCDVVSKQSKYRVKVSPFCFFIRINVNICLFSSSRLDSMSVSWAQCWPLHRPVHQRSVLQLPHDFHSTCRQVCDTPRTSPLNTSRPAATISWMQGILSASRQRLAMSESSQCLRDI